MATKAFRITSGSLALRLAKVGAATVVLIGVLASIPIGPARSGERGFLLARADQGAVPQTKGEPAGADEERLAQRAFAQQIMKDNCLICHAQEMIAGQRLTMPQWKAEVEKMIGWGAPLPPEQAAPLIEYLGQQYSETQPVEKPSRMTYEQAVATVRPEASASELHGDSEGGAKLYSTHCMNCHAPNAQGAELGPNLVGIATLLRPSEYLAVVNDGLRRMPGFKTLVTPQQAIDILVWLRKQKYPSRG
jgi:cytochrome c oxidase cbb3-type subunit 3